MVELLWVLAGATYIATKFINESARNRNEQRFVAQKRFNLDRQEKLERMMLSVDPEERRKFNRILGRTAKLKDGGYDIILAVRQISLREGWQYYYIPELGSDPQFVKSTGGKWPSWRTPGQYPAMAMVGVGRAIAMNSETDRRAVWIERCPHGDEVEVYPMDYRDEEEYQRAVKTAYERMILLEQYKKDRAK